MLNAGCNFNLSYFYYVLVLLTFIYTEWKLKNLISGINYVHYFFTSDFRNFFNSSVLSTQYQNCEHRPNFNMNYLKKYEDAPTM